MSRTVAEENSRSRVAHPTSHKSPRHRPASPTPPYHDNQSRNLSPLSTPSRLTRPMLWLPMLWPYSSSQSLRRFMAQYPRCNSKSFAIVARLADRHWCNVRRPSWAKHRRRRGHAPSLVICRADNGVVGCATVELSRFSSTSRQVVHRS